MEQCKMDELTIGCEKPKQDRLRIGSVETEGLTPEQLRYMLGKFQYMLDWRDKKIEELTRQIAAVDEVIAIAAGYILLLAGDQAVEGQPLRIDKASLHQKIAELRGGVRYIDAGDHILIEFVDEEDAEAMEGGDDYAQETRQEETR